MTTPSSTVRRAFRQFSRAAGGDRGGGGRAGGDCGGGRSRWWRRRMRIVPMMRTMKTVMIRNYEDHEPCEHHHEYHKWHA